MSSSTMPAWSLPASTGETISSADVAGTPYVIYFYPRDNTPGCTTEACDFRDNLARLESAGVKVFGVSADSLKSHDKFVAKYDLPFPLLSDAEHELMEQLEVWGLKKFMGRESMGVIRSTFLVDGEGVIVREWRKVRVKGHVDEVLAAIDEL